MAIDDEKFKRSGNPTLSPQAFEKAADSGLSAAERMTVEGAVNKAGVLFMLLAASAGFIYIKALSQGVPEFVGLALPALLGGLVLGLIISFVPTTAPFLAPVYAVLEGLVLGLVSAIFEARFHGIAVQAAGLTLMTLAGMLLLYKAGIIRATDNFRRGMMMALFAILGVTLLSFIGDFFGHPMAFLWDNGPLGLAIAIGITAVAALCLILDFDMIERGATYGAPKYMEWYSAFGLMVTLIWLYLRILDLLARTRSRN